MVIRDMAHLVFGEEMKELCAGICEKCVLRLCLQA